MILARLCLRPISVKSTLFARSRPLPRVVADLSIFSKPPVHFASQIDRQVCQLRAIAGERMSPFLAKSVTFATTPDWDPAAVKTSGEPHDERRKYLTERYFAVGLIPLFPAALFIHGPVMDFVLATAVSLHFHWGFETIVVDYIRWILFGDTIAKLAKYLAYATSSLLYAGLLYFNYNDVGITKAFELVFSL